MSQIEPTLSSTPREVWYAMGDELRFTSFFSKTKWYQHEILMISLLFSFFGLEENFSSTKFSCDDRYQLTLKWIFSTGTVTMEAENIFEIIWNNTPTFFGTLSLFHSPSLSLLSSSNLTFVNQSTERSKLASRKNWKMFAIILFILVAQVSSTGNYSIEEKCSLYVPDNYINIIAPANVTTVGFQYQILNFDSVDIGDNVSLNSAIIWWITNFSHF